MPIATTDTVTLATLTLAVGNTYTALVNVHRYAGSPEIRLKVGSVQSETYSGTGWGELRLTFTASSTDTFEIVPVSQGTFRIEVDGLLVAAGNYTDRYFDGNSPTIYAGIPFTEINVSYGTDLMVNKAIVQYDGGSFTYTNDDSILAYGSIEKTFDTLLFDLLSANQFAFYVIRDYSEPEYRFSDVAVNLNGLAPERVQEMLELEINDFMRVNFTPNDSGDPIIREGIVTKIEHRVTPDRHDMVVGMSLVGPETVISLF